MRYILLVLFMLIATFASAQVQFLGSPTTTVRNRGNFVSDSLFYLPKRQVAPSDTAAMRYAISDSSVYVWTGNAWRRIGRAGASFLSASDTSSMLSPYIRAAGNGLTKSGQSLLVDTAAMATRARVQKAVDSINGNVALKVNISDTASMLSPYIRHAGNGLTKTGQALSVDTAAIATRARVQKGIDSLGAVKGSGTVTSVSAGTGMSFTTITTTGSVAVDTLTLSTRAWRQKGDDSLGAVIATKVNISDTATMLNPYTRGSGTTNYVPKFTGTRTLGNSSIYESSGNVGIGVTDPDSYLSGGRQLVVANTGGAGGITIRTNSVGDGSIFFSDGTTGDETYRGYVQYIHASDALRFGTTATERMRITSAGELLINTTTDAGDYKLQVNGNIYASGSIVTGSSITPSALYVNGMTTGNGAVYHMGNRLTLANYNTNGRIEFEVNGGTYAMKIDSAGNVGINQTVPTEKLHVGGNIMTAAPSGGTAKPFKIGEAATVSPTSPNRTIRVEIDGTVYYIHAKTTND